MQRLDIHRGMKFISSFSCLTISKIDSNTLELKRYQYLNSLQLDEYSNRVADYFLSLRLLQKGDAVAIYMSNRVEFIGIWLGLAKIGLVPALINSHQRQKSLEHAIIASNSKVFNFRYFTSRSI